MKIRRILRLLFYISSTIVGVILSFVAINVGLNWYERTFKDINYENLKSYCRNNNLSENYAIIVDFNKASGKHRFFVCDLQTNKIISSSLCAHGSGNGSTTTKPVFSNEVGSNCSSLGHYAITGRHKMSSTGLQSFRLKGLDSSNNNAMLYAYTRAGKEVEVSNNRLVLLYKYSICYKIEDDYEIRTS